jgi:glycosyltransferase involved in cell wall biosynthesis
MSGTILRSDPVGHAGMPPGAGTGLRTVCHVVHGMQVGGAEMLVLRMARALRDRYRFVVACLDVLGPLADRLQEEGHTVRLLGREPGLGLACARRLRRFLDEERVDLVHAHQYTPFFQALLARGVRRRPRILFTEHGRHHPDRRNPKHVVFNRLLTRRRDRIVAVGEGVHTALVANEGFPPRKVETIRNGVDLAPFDAIGPELRERTRHALGVAAHEFVVMQVARLDAVKDHATAVRSVERLVRGGRPVRLFVVGDGDRRGEIEREVRERGLGADVVLLGTRSDVPALLAAADAALLTSLSEGIPLTLIEALAARVPVVSTDVGGVREVVAEGECGFLCAAGDDAALAERLARLADDADLRARLGAAGRSRARGEFDEAANHRAYAAVYEEMLGA